MSGAATTNAVPLEVRARQSLGSSHDAIYRMVDRALAERALSSGRLVDVGCGSAGLWRVLAPRFTSYCGLDAVRYQGFPGDGDFRHVDLDAARCEPREADVVLATLVKGRLSSFQDVHWPALRTAPLLIIGRAVAA